MVNRLLCVIAITALGACSTTPVISPPTPELETVPKKVDCLESFVGVSVIGEWCSSIPTSQPQCNCSSPEMPGRIGIFNKLSQNNLSPSDIKLWYGVLPSDYSLERVSDWMLTGIPITNIADWISLGRGAPETAALYKTGVAIGDITPMLEMGLDAKAITSWLKTKIPTDLWHLWVKEHITALHALEYSRNYELTDYLKVKAFLVDRRFTPVDNGVRPQSWICSRSNIAAQLISISDAGVNYIQRYEFIDEQGFPLEAMAFFDLNVNFESNKLAYSVRRGVDSNSNWSVCPMIVATRLKEKYEQQ